MDFILCDFHLWIRRSRSCESGSRPKHLLLNSASYPGDIENLAVDGDADAALRFRGRAVILPQLFQGHVLCRQVNAMMEVSSFLVSDKKLKGYGTATNATLFCSLRITSRT